MGVPGTVSYGPNLQAWCVYLMVTHAVPVQRCGELIASLTGAAPSAGFIHGMLARAAAAVAHVNRLIRCLIIAGPAVCCDETPIRAGPGPAWRKRHLLVACSPLLTWYVLGDRTAASFCGFVLPDLAGVVVHDRYAVYDHPRLGTLTHQLCCAHLLRDLEDAAQAYPDASWPAQITTALQQLIHAANGARARGLPAVPAGVTGPLITAYRDAVTAGLDDLEQRGQPKRPHRMRLLEDLHYREADVLRFVTDTRIPPPPTRPNATCAPPKPRKRSPAGSAPRPPPVTATPSAATCPPPPNTAPAPSPPCATPSPAPPGCRPSPTPSDPRQQRAQGHDPDLNVYNWRSQ